MIRCLQKVQCQHYFPADWAVQTPHRVAPAFKPRTFQLWNSAHQCITQLFLMNSLSIVVLWPYLCFCFQVSSVLRVRVKGPGFPSVCLFHSHIPFLWKS